MTKALLIIDLQNAILSGKGTADRQPHIDAALGETVARLRALKESARAAGVPVVPTTFVEPGTAVPDWGGGEVVVKPAVSAGARDTASLRRGTASW